MFVCLFISVFVCFCVCLFVCLFLCLYVCFCVCLFLCLFVCFNYLLTQARVLATINLIFAQFCVDILPKAAFLLNGQGEDSNRGCLDHLALNLDPMFIV